MFIAITRHNSHDCRIYTAATVIFKYCHQDNRSWATISFQACGLETSEDEMSHYQLNEWTNLSLFPPMLPLVKSKISLQMTAKEPAAVSSKIVSQCDSTHCQWRRRELPGTGGSEGPWSHQSILQQTEKAEQECDNIQVTDTALSNQRQAYRTGTMLPHLRAWSGRWPPCWAGVHAAWLYLLQLVSRRKQ